MEMTANMELTKEKNLMELLDLLRKNNMKEAANSIFEMAAYVGVMEKKMDSVLEELVTVKEQLHKMEERETEKGRGDCNSGKAERESCLKQSGGVSWD